MKIIVANWKMNHAFEEADLWLDSFMEDFLNQDNDFSDKKIILCPPLFIMDYIDGQLMEDGFKNLEDAVAKENKNIAEFSDEELTKIVLSQRLIILGGQDCHHEKSGSFTGDISAAMLKKVGCQYVILGHSERRNNHFETSEIVNKKIRAALAEDISPIICVGESEEIRAQGKHLEFIYQQIMKSVPQDVKFKKLIIAYEPVWSIGTGVTPTAAQIAEVAKFIKKVFNEKLNNVASEFFILYGGSVSAENSKEILAVSNIDGLLVGKASLDAKEFLKICLSK